MFTQNFSNNNTSRIIRVSADDINGLETCGVIQHAAPPLELLPEGAWMWILLHGWRTLLWKYPARTVGFCLPVPGTVKVLALQEPPVVRAFSLGWFSGRPPLRGGAGNNSLLL